LERFTLIRLGPEKGSSCPPDVSTEASSNLIYARPSRQPRGYNTRHSFPSPFTIQNKTVEFRFVTGYYDFHTDAKPGKILTTCQEALPIKFCYSYFIFGIRKNNATIQLKMCVLKRVSTDYYPIHAQ